MDIERMRATLKRHRRLASPRYVSHGFVSRTIVVVSHLTTTYYVYSRVHVRQRYVLPLCVATINRVPQPFLLFDQFARSPRPRFCSSRQIVYFSTFQDVTVAKSSNFFNGEERQRERR